MVSITSIRYRPLSASSYIPTPACIAGKHAVINVINNDLRCFEWAVLLSLYPPTCKSNENNVYSYTKYRDTLNFDGIAFPVRVKDIDRFEELNSDISVNVMSLDEENKGFCTERMSSERHRKHHINLLLLSDKDKNQHYVWIKNFSRLLGDRSKYNGASYVCNSCLNVFSSQDVLDRHVTNCLLHEPQQTVYPSGDQSKLRFKDHDKELPHQFYLVCDFEAFLSPVDCDDDGRSPEEEGKKTRILDTHQISGFCSHRVTDSERHQTPPTVYSGSDVISHFMSM